MQSHAYRNLAEDTPVFGDKGTLSDCGGENCVESGGKGGLDCVADSLEADTVVGADRFFE
jgi:hypothetical protein